LFSKRKVKYFISLKRFPDPWQRVFCKSEKNPGQKVGEISPRLIRSLAMGERAGQQKSASLETNHGPLIRRRRRFADSTPGWRLASIDCPGDPAEAAFPARSADDFPDLPVIHQRSDAVDSGLAPERFAKRHRPDGAVAKSNEIADGGWIEIIDCLANRGHVRKVDPPPASQGRRGFQRAEPPAFVETGDVTGGHGLVEPLEIVVRLPGIVGVAEFEARDGRRNRNLADPIAAGLQPFAQLVGERALP
jgi:hypothetical protein